MAPCEHPPGHACSDATALTISDASSKTAESGRTSRVLSTWASKCERRTPGDDLQRGTVAFEHADGRERTHVDTGVAGGMGTDRLFDNRVIGEHRRERKNFDLLPPVTLDPPDAETIVK